MRHNILLPAALAFAAIFFLPASAQNDRENILPPADTPALQEADADYTPGAPAGGNFDPDYTLNEKEAIISDNARFWKGNNKLFSLGFATGSFDLGKYNGGKLTSRWGVGLKGGGNIMVHPKPIANIVKFGIFIGADITYLNFKKGHGSLSGIFGGEEDDYNYEDDYYYEDDDDNEIMISLGTHYLAAGVAIGPTATVMPFYWCANPNVARIKVRPYFQVVPSYSALIVSDEDNMEVHGAFACLFAGGFELMWRKLSIGFEWKGGRARYKDFVGDLIDDMSGVGNVWVGAGNQKQPRYGCKMFTISLGVEF